MFRRNHLMLLLAFLEVAGKIYFLEEKNNLTIKCNDSEDDQKTRWYEIDEMDWKMTQLNCTSQEQSRHKTKNKRDTCCTDTGLNNRLKQKFLRSGIFACLSFTEDCTPDSEDHLSKNHSKYNIFVIVGTLSNQGSEDLRAIGNNNNGILSVEAEKNITLPCEVHISNQRFILFWIKSGEEKKCVYFFTNIEPMNLSACVDETIQKRVQYTLPNESAWFNANQSHGIEIRNTTASDSGIYLCILSFWHEGKREWKIMNNFSLHVDGKMKKDVNYTLHITRPLYATVGAVGGIMFFAAIIIFFLYLKKNKSQGKLLTASHRGNTAAEIQNNDDCSPYAIGFESNLQPSPEALYSLVNKPSKDPLGEYAEVKLETVPSSEPADAMCVAYSIVNLKAVP